MILHVYGESHGNRWQEIRIDGLVIMIYDLGPATASSFGLQSTLVVNMEKDKVKPGEIVSFVMGEIDCRAHIHKYKDTYKDLIDEIVKHYFIGIRNVVTVNDLTVLVSFITPVPKHNPNIPEIYGLETLPEGKDSERKIYVEYMNQKIKEECEKYNYIFLDAYKEYCNDEGFLEPTLSDGGVHIGNTIYISEKLQKIIENLKK